VPVSLDFHSVVPFTTQPGIIIALSLIWNINLIGYEGQGFPFISVSVQIRSVSTFPLSYGWSWGLSRKIMGLA
jgi:hypothetical protein